MKITQLRLKNFGLYKGEHHFDFTMDPFRTITLVVGKNGVGKTTIPEAINLCIYGPLLLGPRVTEAEFGNYLYARVYKFGALPEDTTEVEVQLLYYKNGNRTNYRICRVWSPVGSGVNDKVSIFENGEEQIGLEKKEKNLFIRELVPPGFSKIMFFNGEQLDLLSTSGSINSFLADSCNSLFGLDLVNILKRDLDNYLAKLASEQKDSKREKEVKEFQKIIVEIERHRRELSKKYSHLAGRKEELEKEIQELENKISERGRWLSERVDELNALTNSLDNEISNTKKSLIEAYNFLGPFAITHKLCVQLNKRLIAEDKTEKLKNSREILGQKVRDLEKSFEDGSFWTELKAPKDIAEQTKLLAKIKSVILDEADRAVKHKIVHDLSESDRNKLLEWTSRAGSEFVTKIKTLTEELEAKEDELRTHNSKRFSFTSKEKIEPLLDQLQKLNHQLGGLENEGQRVANKIEESDSKKEYYSSRLRFSQQKVYEKLGLNSKLGLAGKSNDVLETYSERLLTLKLSKLEKLLVDRFNKLCRKTNYIDRAKIDPETFSIEIYKESHIVNHQHLSAGERQILILAILWSLHSMTSVSLPVVIDTLMARLDAEHRASVINELIPFIGEQVIILGTENELSSDFIEKLSPRISQIYHLAYNPEMRATEISNRELPEPKEAIKA